MLVRFGLRALFSLLLLPFSLPEFGEEEGTGPKRKFGGGKSTVQQCQRLSFPLPLCSFLLFWIQEVEGGRNSERGAVASVGLGHQMRFPGSLFCPGLNPNPQAGIIWGPQLAHRGCCSFSASHVSFILLLATGRPQAAILVSTPPLWSCQSVHLSDTTGWMGLTTTLMGRFGP